MPVGITGDIWFNILELEVDTRVKAAQVDDIGVYLIQWPCNEETTNTANARSVLRCLAVHWWAHYHKRRAREWLEAEHFDSELLLAVQDAVAVEDCIRRVKACTYWSWHRGTRIGTR